MPSRQKHSFRKYPASEPERLPAVRGKQETKVPEPNKGLTASAVSEQSKIMSKGKPPTVVATPGPRRLSLDDLRKAAAVRKSGR